VVPVVTVYLKFQLLSDFRSRTRFKEYFLKVKNKTDIMMKVV